ncbi:HD domain-containing protein [Thermogemmatispora sp.]|uniref:HD domain-containing protein n=1 Tax=Thermogemmatispora sp. TaxID=1968838 RepID=UPI001DDB58F6|nr:HD domain-containing protein [Thermogemmatispora sp.]MBX5451363.1 CCA tRNA nucleotidyltransferase [Thermogemmatispora sp.]
MPFLEQETYELLQQVARFFARQHQSEVYLVGGALRNLLLNSPSVDWDLVVAGEAPRLARQLADALGGYYAHMHEKASRVVIRRPQGEWIIDVAPLTGSIEEDLRQRDFTINAIALPLDALLHTAAPSSLTSLPWIDPCGGLADAQAGLLRAVNAQVFQARPVRLLRAIRFARRYSLRIEPATEALIRRDARLLTEEVAERLLSELYKLLELEDATRSLRLLDRYGLLTVLVPELGPARGMPQPPPHYWDVFEHSLETVSALEAVAHALQSEPRPLDELSCAAWCQPLLLGPDQTDHLAQLRALVAEATRQGLLSFSELTKPAFKLAALLHDIGKPATLSYDEEGTSHFYGHQQAGTPLAEGVMKRLSTSGHDRHLVRLVTLHHMRPGQLARQEFVTPRAIRRYFVDLGAYGLHVALFSLADHLATYGPGYHLRPAGAWEAHLACVALLFRSYLYERERFLPTRLLSGHELMRRLGLQPGPLVGELLEIIAEARAEERIHSKEEALWLAREYLQTHEAHTASRTEEHDSSSPSS